LNSNGSMQTNVDKVESPSAMRFLLRHSPTEARSQATPGRLPWAASHEKLNGSGFGDWADEKRKTAREAGLYVLLDGTTETATEPIQRFLLPS